MQYQKIKNVLDNTANQASKFRAKNWVEINGDSCETYNTISKIKFKTSVLKLSLSYYSDAYIQVNRPLTIPDTGTATAPNNTNKKVVFASCAPFTDFINLNK